MTRSARLDMEPFVKHLKQVLEEIRTEAFVEEWKKEKEVGYPLLNMLRAGTQKLPMHRVEERVRNALRRSSDNTKD